MKRKTINTQPTPVSLDDILARFQKHNQVKGLSKATINSYRKYITFFISWMNENNHNTLSNEILDDYIIFLQSRDMKSVSVASNMKHIRAFVNFGKKSGDFNSSIEVMIPKYDVIQKEPYTREEMRQLVMRPRTDSWIEWRNWAMVNYLISTGQRLSTVINIKVADVDLNEKTVFLRHNKDRITKRMPLSTSVCHILKEYIHLSNLTHDEYLFPNFAGGQLKAKSCQDSIAAYNQSRGVDKTSIHLFRHTFAKEYIINGGNPAKLQKLLNHKDITMTLHYVNLYGNEVASDLDLYDPLNRLNTNKKRTII